MLDDLNQVTAAVALRTPELCETIPEGRRELCKKQISTDVRLHLHIVWIDSSQNPDLLCS